MYQILSAAMPALTLGALKYFCINHGDQSFFQFAKVDFRRQNLTSTDVRF